MLKVMRWEMRGIPMRLCAVAVILGGLLATAEQSHAFGQQLDNEIVIRVKEVATTKLAPVASAATYLNGYRSSISGQVMEYHSSDPDVDSALIVRAQSITHSISWETDPMPELSNDYSQFIWLVGIECAGFEQEKDSHQFNFLIDGQHWFTFKNVKDSSAKNWRIAGKDGAELSFVSVMSDGVGDLFGYMMLKVPGKDFEPGKPLMLEVNGDNSGSADWYMTFQHRFSLVPQVRAEPALVRDGAGASQLLRLSLDNLAGDRMLEVHVPNHQPVNTALKIGSNVLHLPIPAVTSEVTFSVRFELNDRLV